jgi:hypothetical protein
VIEANIYHVDDCMYVAASTREEAAAYVREECGEMCGDLDWVEQVSPSMPVTRANVDDGEEATPETMTTVGVLLQEHLAGGGTLPCTVCFDSGM